MKRVVVTGASGFVGGHVLGPLAERGFEVHAVSRRARGDCDERVIWHVADLLRAGEPGRIVGELEPSHLLHLAWYTEPGAFWHSERNLAWLRASIDLLYAFAAGGRRAVLAGTCAEYVAAGRPHAESDRVEAASLYGAAKIAAATILRGLAVETRMSAAWGRIFFMYGPYEDERRLVASVITRLLRGEPAACTVGTQIRDYMHVQDVGSAFAALLDSGVEGPVNVASGEAVEIRRIVELIAELTGRPDLVRFGAVPIPDGEAPAISADTSRLRGELGWAPQLDLGSGLAATVEWWRGRLQR